MDYLKYYCGLSLVKLSLFNMYKSTDYDVHQNWKQITYSLPMKEWYFECSQ